MPLTDTELAAPAAPTATGGAGCGRASGLPEGSFGFFSFGEPLRHTDQRWSYGIGGYWRTETARRYESNGVPERYDAPGTAAVEAGQRVVTTGPYSIVRHPMYSASVLWFLATPFALGSPWALVPAALMSIAVGARLVDEEHHLCAALPGYDAYCVKVRWRLIPGLW